MWNWIKRKFGPIDLSKLTSEELMAICDRFWEPGTLEYAEFARASNELAKRGPEIRDWCRRLIVHPDYWARETGAFLLGQLGRRGQLGDQVEVVVAELGALANRAPESDGKELQAVGAAITALAEIGHRSALPYLRTVLLSDDPDTADCRWEAAEALGRIVGQQFQADPNREQAARDWLAAHPDE